MWRRKQFYETYFANEKLATLLRELSWSYNIQIMPCKTDKEREFYLTLYVKNRYTCPKSSVVENLWWNSTTSIKSLCNKF
ncbi:MAG: DUF1016 N-terminal domain-containing protein [Firmicutes bacterium]|nr:DUF1016 N-terminal domain-containing protein [Bacillota bacterium]